MRNSALRGWGSQACGDTLRPQAEALPRRWCLVGSFWWPDVDVTSLTSSVACRVAF